MAVDPFDEVSRRLSPFRAAVAFSEGLADSPFVYVSVVFAACLPVLAWVWFGQDVTVGVALMRAAVAFSVVAGVALGSAPLARLAERRMSARVVWFAGPGESASAGMAVREVPMSALVRGFLMLHPVPLLTPPRLLGRHFPGHDPVDMAVAGRMLHAVEMEGGGVHLLKMMASLSNRVEVLHDRSVRVGDVLDVLEAVPAGRSGFVQALSWMAAAEVFTPSLGAGPGSAAPGLLVAVRRMSEMTEEQSKALRALLRSGWTGSVEDLLDVSEMVAVLFLSLRASKGREVL